MNKMNRLIGSLVLAGGLLALGACATLPQEADLQDQDTSWDQQAGQPPGLSLNGRFDPQELSFGQQDAALPVVSTSHGLMYLGGAGLLNRGLSTSARAYLGGESGGGSSPLPPLFPYP